MNEEVEIENAETERNYQGQFKFKKSNDFPTTHGRGETRKYE